MREKRILQVAASYLNIGGVEYQLNALTRALSKKFKIHLAADGSSEFCERYLQAGGIYTRWKVGSKFDPGAVASFNKLLNSIKPDIVHIHDARAGWLLKPLLLMKRIPCVYTTHLPPYIYFGQGRLSGLRQVLYQKIEQLLNIHFTSAVIYVSKSIYTHALEEHLVTPAKANLILNGIDLDPFKEISVIDAKHLKLQANIPDEMPVICSVARLSVQKDFPFLLNAGSQLYKEGYNFAIWIIGSGPERDSLDRLVRELRIESLVKFWGDQTNIPPFLSVSNIFVLTSRYEGGRTVAVMEAQAAGKPCVLSSVADHSALVEHGTNGFIFDQGDQSAFVKAIKVLLDSPGLLKSFGEAAREKAFREYDIQIAASKHEELYDLVLSRAGKLPK